ncbi:flavin monoamine oxidase family protein [Hymenobacter sp. GOD-10R]|uniref:flavin monoamine oxidase family protein n=1 Tax=Hymenobacter sp. GOD-10R TaxID=3093922 RepID=UPI002D791376|nr:FAD-dependent oxidoreductase [Hymenobacter sp. GOD-10R]WRQ29704.1 FAD-dependent oxidoreductase [Hymenobacter sp. GOD-10R]
MKALSRRDFLTKSAIIGAGAYPAMLALNLLPAAPAHAFNLQGSGKGKHIIILGAGLAGMTSAYELTKLGYQCTVLEARTRTGGRCWSIRNGATAAETNNPQQTARFDNGLYFNAGPSRIPHHHQLTMHYCRELGVPLEVYNNVNESTYYYAEGKGPLSNKKVRAREVHNDMRGYMSELLAKAVDQRKLDTGLTQEDAAKVLEYLRAEGGLDIDKLYKASARRGYTEAPGAGTHAGKLGDPLKLAEIIQSGLLDPDFYNVAEYTYELQMTMFQAVGGMDQIAKALEKRVVGNLKLGAEVTAIQNQTEGVKITYKDQKGTHELIGDLCICTLPLPVLSNVNHNFSSDVSRAIDFVPYIQTGKIGLQFKRRFWEEDEQIFGGITHTNNDLTQIFYPSYDYLGKKGILIGYYNFNEKAKKVGDLTYQEREKLALQKGQLIHPQYPKEFEQSFSVSWHKLPYSLGGWALYNSDERKTHYAALLKPEKNVYFAGEHTTYLTAWMAGAFESARSVVAAVHGRLSEQRLSYPSVGSN